jgi:PLP dependent protein
MTVKDRTDEIKANLNEIRSRIDKAAAKSGRSSADVRLVVVTKAQTLEITQAAIQAGSGILGENYPEEALPKIEALRGEGQVEWHMIGHLQSRKARIVAQHFDVLHSLDSVKLSEKIQRLLEESNRNLPVLLEVNLGEEESKYGWPAKDTAQWEELLPVIEQIRQMPNLQIKGLMTMPPLFDDPELSRPYFRRLRTLMEYLNQQFPDENYTDLSMGTSTDFVTAVEEGATYVRIGQAIVGARPKL